LSKWLCQSCIAMSKWRPSPSTWSTDVRTSVTFGARTPSLAPLVSPGRAHDLHGDAPKRMDASISSVSPFSRRKLGRNGVAVVSSLRRARPRSSLHHHPPKLAHSSAVTCSPTSILKLAVKPSGELTFPIFPKSGRRDCFLRRAQC